MSVFSGRTALIQSRSLCFPRRTGGEGWRRSRELISAQFEELEYALSDEPFPIQADPLLFYKGLITFSLLLLVLSFIISRHHPLTAAFLMFLPALAVSGSAWAWNTWIEKGFFPLKPKANPGHNIVASLGAAQDHQERVLLTAHYDSKCQSHSLVHRSLLLISLALLSLIMALLYLSASGLGIASLEPPTRKEMAFLTAVTSLCALILYKIKTFDLSPGALDNAGGVGVLLALAEALQADPPSQVHVTFLITDAEEEGLLGAWAYLKAHRNELSPDSTHIINLDGVGLRGRLKAWGGWRSPITAQILQCGRRNGVPLGRWPILPGILMDHLPFRRAGYDAISLFSLSRKSLRIHTPKDSPELLEEEGLRETGDLVLTFIREIDQAIFPSAGVVIGPRGDDRTG